MKTDLKMDKVIDRAVEIIWRWPKHYELKEILGVYKGGVRYFKKVKKKSESPYHYATGKPLKASTLYQVRCDFKRSLLDCAANKLLIKLFVLDGVFGQPSVFLKQRLEGYFAVVDEQIVCKQFNFAYLKKELGELKAKKPGPSYKTREGRLAEHEINIIHHYVTLIDEKRKIVEDLKQRLSFLESTVPQKTQTKQIREKRKNDLGLSIIDGGKKFNPDHGPFAPLNPS